MSKPQTPSRKPQAPSPKPILDLLIDRPVAGGRMLARHDGVVVLVAGAIPGERVRVSVERSTRSLIWAQTIEVIEPAPSRRPLHSDPACGGLDYAHIAYAHQLRCKAQVVADAFRRIGKMTVDEAMAVEPSPERGYRLRARLHVHERRVGFFREGTHVLCDAGATEQLRSETMAAVESVVARLGEAADDVNSIIVAENVAATECVLHLEPRETRPVEPFSQCDFGGIAGVTGVAVTHRGRVLTLMGRPSVSDSGKDLFGPEPPVPATTLWTRHATSFFQGNRFLIGSLLGRVLDVVVGDRVADFYAGAGFFTVACAARGARVTAVEGDASSGSDLQANAAPWPDRVVVLPTSVEDALPRLGSGAFDTIVLDPPRTGVSPVALDGIVRLDASRVVYVSCDPATLARDAAKLVAVGYALESIRAFDLFPNTAHVETVVSFDRAQH